MTPQEYALSLLHIPYLWNGKSPLIGLDCSGFVCEVLKMANVLGYKEELSSQELYYRVFPIEKKYGITLIFFGASVTQIDHVSIGLTNILMIESGGGDHTTVSLEIAKEQDARVKIRPINYRKDKLTTLFI